MYKHKFTDVTLPCFKCNRGCSILYTAICKDSSMVHRGIARALKKLWATKYHKSSWIEKDTITKLIMDFITKHHACNVSDKEYKFSKLLK